VSIDLDGIDCYYRIHALGAPPSGLERVIYERAIPRAVTLFEKRGMNATWFVVGRDAVVEANAAVLRELVARGDELGNHSHSHYYDLARRDAGEIGVELVACDAVLRKLAGAPIRGFRAPGYDVSPAMLDTLARLNYHYDSSVFPAPGYYAAKAAVMALLAVTGRSSGAVMTNPRALIAPANPYRPSMAAPWRRGQAPVVELPVAVTPWTRLPAIGTSLIVAPAMIRSRLVRAMAGRAFFNFELHGIDFADAEKDGIPAELVARQPDLRVPIAEKLARLEQLLDQLAAGWRFQTLAEVAAAVQRTA
jgi:hypothetical protein